MQGFSVNLDQQLKPDAFLDLLEEAATEKEGTEFRIKAIEQKTRKKIENRKLYPYISDLNLTGRTLLFILNRVEELEYTKPVIQHIDWENEQMIVKEEAQIEPGETFGWRLGAIKWAYQDIVRPLLSDAKEAYTQIEEKLECQEMEPNAMYANEGFLLLLLPGQWRLYKYALKNVVPAGDLHSGLDVSLCTGEEAGRAQHPTKKTDLGLDEYMDSPLSQGNPAVFSYSFPQWYDPTATALPVAERELLATLQHNQ